MAIPILLKECLSFSVLIINHQSIKCKSSWLVFVRISLITLSHESVCISLYTCKRAKDERRSVDIEDHIYVFTLLVAFNDDLWLRKPWLHKRLNKFLMKL